MSMIGRPRKGFNVISYNKQKDDAIARLKAAAPKITCSWCGKLVNPNEPRMRIFESESTRVSGKWLAHFHPECGDALLDFCEMHIAALAAL